MKEDLEQLRLLAIFHYVVRAWLRSSPVSQ